MIEELGERVHRCIAEENTGNNYKRLQSIKLRVLDGHINQVFTPRERCSFTNQHGFCLEDVGHEGKHRCVFLGKDDY